MLVDLKSQLFNDPTQVVVPARTKLVAVVDHACTLSKGYSTSSSEGALFSQKIMSPQAEHFQKDGRAIKVHSHTIQLSRDMSLSELQSLADADSCLTMLSSNVSFRPLGAPNDTKYSNGDLTHLPFIKFDTAYDQFYSGVAITSSVVIAVIDSGVDISHNEFSGILWVNTGETASNSIDDDANGYVDDVNGYNLADNIDDPSPIVWPSPYTGEEGHGTHVAGLAAAKVNNNLGVTGVAGFGTVQIMAVNVFGSQPSADTSIIDEAIRYAYNNGANVINLSLGGPGRADSTGTAIQEAVNAGVVVVAAAGNSDEVLDDNNFMTPASFAPTISGMISVGSLDDIDGTRSSFSNCGTSVVEIGAPGAHDSTSSTGGLWSTFPNNLYARLMGTSMASPVVAGAAALVIGVKKTQSLSHTPAQVETILESHATQDATLANYFKSGRVLNLKAIADALGL